MSRKKIGLRSMTPMQMSESVARSGLIWQPEAHHPIYGLAMIQHLVRGGGLYGDDDLDDSLARHFGDDFNWGHFQEVWSMFKLGVEEEAVDTLLAALTTVIFCLRAILGTDGAWRMWNAIFEAALSGVEVDFPDSSEGVATLKRTEPDQAPGWDAYYPYYQLFALRALESSRDDQAVMAYMTYAASTNGDSFVRKAADGYVRLAHELPAGVNRGQLEAFGDIRDSLALTVLKRNPGLADSSLSASPTPHQANYAGYFGSAAVDPRRGADWAQAQIELRRRWGSPAYPIEGGRKSDLDALAAIQEYGARRDLDGDGSADMTHWGLDLEAPEGTGVKAMYGGVVKWSETGWKKGDGPKGNYVILEHVVTTNGQTRAVTTEYYHLKKATVAPGDRVAQGDVIGQVGNTGNSHGAHLHLVVRVGIKDDLGRSGVRRTVNPELVLRNGLAAALAATGTPIAPGKPHLALGSLVLRGAVSAPGGSSLPPRVIAAYEEQSKGTLGYTMSKAEAVELLKANHAAGSPFEAAAYGGWFDDVLDYAAAGLTAGVKFVAGDEVGSNIIGALNDFASSDLNRNIIGFFTTGPGAQALRSIWTANGLPGAHLEPLQSWMGAEYERQLTRAQGNESLAKAATIRSAQAKLTADDTLDADQTVKAVQAVTEIVKAFK